MKIKRISPFLTACIAAILAISASVQAQEATIEVFTGGDPGEGLDFEGTFVYAVNMVGPGGGQIGDALFTDDMVDGVTVMADQQAPNWHTAAEYGDTPADDALELLMESIRWSAAPEDVFLTLENLEIDQRYGLQLIFAEAGWDRGFDIIIEDTLVADEFNPGRIHELLPSQGAVVTYEFKATSDTLEIVLSNDDASFPDTNPILNAFTLKELDPLTDDPNLLTSTSVAFGQVASAPPATKTLTLRSVGATQPVNISEIRFTGAAAENFSVLDVPETIAAGETADIQVQFDSMGTSGGFFAEMEIVSDDSSDSVIILPVSANVVNLNGPAAWYPMDETSIDQGLRDTSGNGRSGEIEVGAGEVQLGQEGLAGGTSIAVGGGAHGSLSGASFEPFDSFTISLWINADAVPAEALQTLVGKGDAEGPVLAMLLDGNALAWFSGSEMSEFKAPDSIVAGQTHHVAAVYDNTAGARVATLYVDGQPVATQEEPVVLGDSTDFDFRVGAYNGVLPFSGRLDDVHIYSRALSDADISFLHENPGMAVGVGGEIDSDGDTLSDEEEVALGTDPLEGDTDGDGLDDGEEVELGTDPLVTDSDGDGIQDGLEVDRGTDPLDANDLPDPVLQISTFTGGDPGEGLDFEGSFLYAVNVLGAGGAQIGEALFTNDMVDGVTVASDQEALNWHPGAEFGDTPADDALEFLMESIRWSQAPEDLVLTLENLVVDRRYVLQLIFAEACCDRGFDVIIQDTLEADEFSPGAIHERLPTQGTVGTYSFTATSDTLNVVLSNDDATFPDINPILNAFTLKEIGAEGDADEDGLLDSWERLHFGDTSATPDGDPDGDTLTNAEEFELKTDPDAADTDGDGLDDAEELAASTDPLVADSDGDGLSDGDEMNTHGTDPLVADTDGDGFSDGMELALASDPNDAASQPEQLAIFTGGDEGEGLDLDGNFVYAINMLGPGDLPVRDALFTDDSVEGFTFDQPNEIIDWHNPDYGDTANDDNLEVVMQSIRWNAGPVSMSLAGLTPGESYKLQLLFAENCCDRGWDIELEGEVFLDDFNVQRLQGGINNQAQGVAVVYEFTAEDDTLEINFINDAPAFPDNNPILNGLTLEAVDDVIVIEDSDGDGVTDDVEAVAGTDPDDPLDYLRVLSTERTANAVEIRWSTVDGRQYTIEYSETLLPGSWEAIMTGQTGTDGVGDFEDTDATRIGGQQGYYRAVIE